MNIRKSNDNLKDRKLKCFNYNKYRYIAKEYQKKKEKNTRKCFKYEKVGHITKDCKEKQLIKKQSIQKKSDKEDNENNQKGFGEDIEQA